MWWRKFPLRRVRVKQARVDFRLRLGGRGRDTAGGTGPGCADRNLVLPRLRTRYAKPPPTVPARTDAACDATDPGDGESKRRAEGGKPAAPGAFRPVPVGLIVLANNLLDPSSWRW